MKFQEQANSSSWLVVFTRNLILQKKASKKETLVLIQSLSPYHLGLQGLLLLACLAYILKF